LGGSKKSKIRIKIFRAIKMFAQIIEAKRPGEKGDQMSL
jgi:hypothetical protein